jgi:hypothetical protein
VLILYKLLLLFCVLIKKIIFFVCFISDGKGEL